jgi:hypothetical protein
MGGRMKLTVAEQRYAMKALLATERAEIAEARIQVLTEALEELVNFLDVDHWCGSCEEFQERGKGEWCPLGQRLTTAHAALATPPQNTEATDETRLQSLSL